MAQDFDTGTYSETDASNNASSPNGMPEGMAPSGVNDSWRTGIGASKRAFDRDHAGAWCTVGGTGNAITLTYSVAPTAYIQGQKYSFKASAANSGTTTVNVNALGVKNVFKKSAAGAVACSGGEIQASDLVEIEYDGTQYQILGGTANPITGGTATQVFASNGASAPSFQDGYRQTIITSGTSNFTIPAATFWAQIWGGGAGSAGGGTNNFGSGGGGAGGYSAKLFTSQTVGGTIAYSVGGGGTGGSAGGAGTGGAGGGGGNTTFGTLTALGGTAGGAGTGVTLGTGGAGGTASGGDLNLTGVAGGQSAQVGSVGGGGGAGGGSPFGGPGGQSAITAANCGGATPGGGAGGPYAQTNIVGGNAGAGLIIVRW